MRLIDLKRDTNFTLQNQSAVKGQKLGLCQQSLIFLSHRRVSPFSRGVILTRACVSLALLSLREMRTTRCLRIPFLDLFIEIREEQGFCVTKSVFGFCVRVRGLRLKGRVKRGCSQLIAFPPVFMLFSCRNAPIRVTFLHFLQQAISEFPRVSVSKRG